MGGALRRPTKFDSGAIFQQCSNIFYQKFIEIVSVGGCGEEKGFKGKRNRRSRLRLSLSPASQGFAFLRNFAREKKGEQEKHKETNTTRGYLQK
jgi:hypothetical protein